MWGSCFSLASPAPHSLTSRPPALTHYIYIYLDIDIDIEIVTSTSTSTSISTSTSTGYRLQLYFRAPERPRSRLGNFAWAGPPCAHESAGLLFGTPVFLDATFPSRNPSLGASQQRISGCNRRTPKLSDSGRHTRMARTS